MGRAPWPLPSASVGLPALAAREGGAPATALSPLGRPARGVPAPAAGAVPAHQLGPHCPAVRAHGEICHRAPAGDRRDGSHAAASTRHNVQRPTYRALTALIYSHISPYGTFLLDMRTRLDLEQPEESSQARPEYGAASAIGRAVRSPRRPWCGCSNWDCSTPLRSPTADREGVTLRLVAQTLV
jgi:hypothetical protein